MLSQHPDVNVYVIASISVLGVVVLSYIITSSFRTWIICRTTALYDVKKAGTPRSGERIKGTAVICGGRCVSSFELLLASVRLT